MSSVQSFLKQRTAGAHLYTYSATDLYVLVAGSGNVVGNYANDVGFMVTLAQAAANAGMTGIPAPTPVIIRDMGKTVKATVSSSVSSTTSTAVAGYFRQVQCLTPTVTSLTFGVNGQAAGTFPSAGNTGDKGFNSYYVPIMIGGSYPSNAAGTALVSNSLSSLLGSQM